LATLAKEPKTPLSSMIRSHCEASHFAFATLKTQSKMKRSRNVSIFLISLLTTLEVVDDVT
jgi:hypothetical protein